MQRTIESTRRILMLTSSCVFDLFVLMRMWRQHIVVSEYLSNKIAVEKKLLYFHQPPY